MIIRLESKMMSQDMINLFKGLHSANKFHSFNSTNGLIW